MVEDLVAASFLRMPAVTINFLKWGKNVYSLQKLAWLRGAMSRRIETRRRRWRKTAWGRVYVALMRAGIEVCRLCGTRDHPSNPLTIDHIIPLSMGGSWALCNLTILCSACNQFKGAKSWPSLTSLLVDEQGSDVHRRWSELVQADLFRRRYQCPTCHGWYRADQTCRLVPHPGADGMLRCAGTRSRMPDDSVAAVIAVALQSAWAKVLPIGDPRTVNVADLPARRA